METALTFHSEHARERAEREQRVVNLRFCGLCVFAAGLALYKVLA